MGRDIFNKIDEEYFHTILDDDFKFEGTIKFEDSSIIKGCIKGKIESKSDLIIGPNAVIEADIVAKKLECFGMISGNVVVDDEAYFHSPAILNGSLETKLLTFEKGCSLNGEVKMDKDNTQLNMKIKKRLKIL